LKRVLLVCTGNTCRSPMAEAMLIHMSKEKQFPLEVRSAGIYAMSGSEISPQAKEVLESKGITVEHYAQRLDEALADWADVILTMTPHHKHEIVLEMPTIAEKVYTITEYDDQEDLGISDPFGASVDVYQQCAEEIQRHLAGWLEKWREQK
jgi:protein-tyrosine-phosphatase